MGEFGKSPEQFAAALTNWPSPGWAFEAVADLRDLEKTPGINLAGVNALMTYLKGAIS
jgi:hypothetical protein